MRCFWNLKVSQVEERGATPISFWIAFLENTQLLNLRKLPMFPQAAGLAEKRRFLFFSPIFPLPRTNDGLKPPRIGRICEAEKQKHACQSEMNGVQ